MNEATGRRQPRRDGAAGRSGTFLLHRAVRGRRL